MSTADTGTKSVGVVLPDSTTTSAALWLTTTTVLALIAYYSSVTTRGRSRYSDPTPTCTNSCTMPATCSASPATEIGITMEKQIIGLGLLAGAVAGGASFLYARTQIAPLIADSISYEEARSHAAAAAGGEHTHEHEVFTRAVQENIGAGVGTVMFAVITGALFAVAVTIALATLRRHRIAADPRLVAVLVAVAGFITVAAVPWVAYPATLPGVGQPATAGARTTAYLAVIIASVVLAAIASTTALRLAPRLGGWTAAVTGCVGYLAAISAVIMALPSFDETPLAITGSDGTVLFPGFPADLLADFRTHALICQALLWFVIAGSLAVLLPRALTAGRANTTGGELHAHR